MWKFYILNKRSDEFLNCSWWHQMFVALQMTSKCVLHWQWNWKENQTFKEHKNRMYTSRMMVYLNIGGFNHHLGYFSCGINCKHHITWLFRFSNVYYIIQKLECNSHHIYSLYAMSNNSIHALHSLFVNCRRKNKRYRIID